ncbi:MAG: pilus assembly protein PilM [Gammaproteobacteria bacterium]|nr:pilus assembly protein PilM [Gammaproteobacteria bacterium]
MIFYRRSQLKGLDLSTSIVRAVHLIRKGEALYVSQSWIGDVHSLSSFSSNAKVAISVPYSEVQCQTLSLDAKLNAFEIEVLVAEIFPSPEWWMDFACLGASSQGARTREVRVVACPQKVIQTKLQALEACDLIPQIVDTDLFAIERVFALFLPSLNSFSTVAGIYLHSTFCSFTVFKGEQVIKRHYQGVVREEEGSAHLEGVIRQYRFSAEGPLPEHVMVMASPAASEVLFPVIQGQLPCSASFHTPAQVMLREATQNAQAFYQDNACWALATGLALRAFSPPS